MMTLTAEQMQANMSANLRALNDFGHRKRQIVLVIEQPGIDDLRIQVGRVDDDHVMEFACTKSSLAHTHPDDWLSPSLESMWAEYQARQRTARAASKAAATAAIKRAMAV